MKAIVEKSQISGINSLFSGICVNNGLESILESIFIKAKKADGENPATVTLVGTNTQLWVTVVLDAEVEEEGISSIPVKSFNSFVSKIRGDKICFEVKENKMTIRCGKSRISSGSMDCSSFPQERSFEPTAKFTVDGPVLFNMFKRVIPSASRDGVKLALNGVCLERTEEALTVVATDGRRLAMVEYPMEKIDADISVVIPIKTVVEINKLLANSSDKIDIELDNKQIKFVSNNIYYNSTLISDKYPPYRSIIPKDDSFKSIINIPVKDFTKALEIINITIKDKATACVKVNIESNNLNLKSLSNGNNDSEDSVDVVYDGDPITVNLNPEFLLDVVKTVDVLEIELKIIQHDHPIVFEDKQGMKSVIMPLKI